MNTYIRLRGACCALLILSAFLPHFLFAQAAGKLEFSKYPQRFDNRKPMLPDQKLLLRFNTEVEAEKVADHFEIFNESKKDVIKIPVKSRRPSLDEIRSYGTYLIRKDLSQDKIASLHNRFVILEPARDLSEGFNWHLQAKAGLTNYSGSYSIKENYSITIGFLDRFSVNRISAVNPYDTPMTLYVAHNKYQLAEGFDAEKLANYISVSPQPADFAIKIENFGIRLAGKFEYHKAYQVEVKPGIVGNDKTKLERFVKESIRFEPNTGFVRLPLFSETQNASGHRTFEVETANLNTIDTRVKSLKGDSLIFSLKGYKDGYKGRGGERTIPFSMVPGKTIYKESRKREAEIDITEKFSMDWSEINSESKHGAYYVSVGGVSDADSTEFGTHALVQVTDIAMAWKQTESETLIYAFSIKNGSPKDEMPIRLVTNEGEEVAVVKTDKDGIARFAATTYKEDSLWLDAATGDDRHVMPFSRRMDRIGLWSFDIPSRYSGVKEGERRTLIFTDRDVYKPGEKVYLKCISRTIDSDSLMPVEPCVAQYTVKDRRGRKIVDKQITLSANGTFNDEINIPELGLGYHSIEIDFNDPENEDPDWERISRHNFNVAEYRVNTFEVAMDARDVVAQDIVTVPLSARYYMGKPLSKAQVTWNSYSRNQYPNPKGFEEFNFGDRYQDRDGDSKNEEIRLGRNGQASIEVEIPMNSDSPAPRYVSVNAEVTDVNQQTISEHTSFTVHSSDFYIGIRKPEGVHRAGDTVPFVIANINNNGSVFEEPVKIIVSVEKEIWNTVKVKGSDGKITHRNEKHHDLKHRETVDILTRKDAGTSLALSQSHDIKFDEAGDYVITLESVDASGRRVLTKEGFTVIGAEEPAWRWNDVVAIDLIPDRKSYKVGDTANLLVRSPVFGRALVTTERGDVKSTRMVDISEHETVIEIPIEPGAAPNIFASVLIVRGSDRSPHKNPSADYRLGYCQLDIDDPGIDLAVTLDAGDEKYYIPGQPIEIAALVADADGNGVPGAEVTLYAVDEGILSLTGYETPDPGAVFNEAFPLSVMMGQSLSDLLPENPLERDFGNKGFVIGGGGMAEGQAGNLGKIRKDFKAVAFWKADLLTDESGKVTHTVTAPDNLTSFRLMAIVAKGNRFGSADSPLVINKPLIIEPAIPSFSNLSDQIDLTAVLHNNTEQTQQLKVEVELDEHAIFIDKLGSVIPTNLDQLRRDARKQIHRMSIDPGQTEVIHLPVAMTKTGEAKWKWKVNSVTDSKLIDYTESKLPIGFPLPLLKSSKSVTVKDGKNVENVLSEVNPRLLDGNGDIEITVSNSRMIEATDALDYLLEYPYGCVEQTTSTTIPWMSTGKMRKVLPSLDVSEEDINRAIKKGTSRLLSMQTGDGGLSYWPGDRNSVLWGSAYGGLALATASKNGVELPKESLEDLWSYLSGNLRNLAKTTEPYELSQRCLSAYTLAVAGKSEPAYLDVLYNKRKDLPREARALLALAMMEGDPADQRVETLLTENPGKAISNVGWYRKPYLKATELMAWTKFRPGAEKTDQLLSDLMGLRRPGRDWGSTYSNAWPLMALASHSDIASQSQLQNEVTLQFGERTETVSFDGSLASQTFKFPFEGDLRKQLMQLKIKDAGTIYTNIKVATQPKLLPMVGENKGYAIDRTYHKLDMEGNLQPVDDLMVGDLVMARIDVDIDRENGKYIAIDDPLPSILEAVNPNFKTQKTRVAKRTKGKELEKVNFLYTNHRELRKDRTLFFADNVYRSGKHRIQYVTRVIAPGESIAPPAKIEAMYEPDRYGLSRTQTLSARTLDLKENQVASR